MKKLLIFYNEEELKPIGGPCGYLYSLNRGLKEQEDVDVKIDFLHCDYKLGDLKKGARSSKNKLIQLLLKKYLRIRHICDILRIIYRQKDFSINIGDYDAIHFHTTRDLFVHRKSLEKYTGQVLLTSHSPQPLYKEYIEGSSKLELAILGRLYLKLKRMDEYAFKRADKIIFPCESADEPYINAWEEYATIKQNKIDSFRYFLTGTVGAKVKNSREEVRKKYGIPQNAFLISYVGRHNEIKGYDKLKEVGADLIRNDSNTYVLVAGSIGPLQPLKDSHWIEVGWTNDPHSIISAADVFMLPNKETYFDLVLLEVLSIGTPVIISNTGGNKFFKDISGNGIFLYDSLDECKSQIEKIKMKEPEVIHAMIDANRNIYSEYFTTKIFARNYLTMIKAILSEEND